MYHAAFRIDNDSKFTELVRIAFGNLNKRVNSTRKIPEKKRQTVFSLRDNPLALHIPSRVRVECRRYFGMQISWPKKNMKYNFAATIGRKKNLNSMKKNPPFMTINCMNIQKLKPITPNLEKPLHNPPNLLQQSN